MREILFRGKRKDNGEWIEGWYVPPVDYDGNHWDASISYKVKSGHLEDVEVIPETVGQYTGLTDKNGTKIFEGDILNCYSFSGVNDFRNRIVVWSELFLCFKADKPLYGDGLQIYEIIGNIHDNSKLLGDK